MTPKGNWQVSKAHLESQSNNQSKTLRKSTQSFSVLKHGGATSGKGGASSKEIGGGVTGGARGRAVQLPKLKK